jgi:hypothetical protein
MDMTAMRCRPQMWCFYVVLLCTIACSQSGMWGCSVEVVQECFMVLSMEQNTQAGHCRRFALGKSIQLLSGRQ